MTSSPDSVPSSKLALFQIYWPSFLSCVLTTLQPWAFAGEFFSLVVSLLFPSRLPGNLGSGAPFPGGALPDLCGYVKPSHRVSVHCDFTPI